MPATVSSPSIFWNGVEYTIPSHVKFVQEMLAAKIPVELRKTHVGCSPCVRVKDKDNALKRTTVGCNWQDGIGFVTVFPYGLDKTLSHQQRDSWGF